MVTSAKIGRKVDSRYVHSHFIHCSKQSRIECFKSKVVNINTPERLTKRANSVGMDSLTMEARLRVLGLTAKSMASVSKISPDIQFHSFLYYRNPNFLRKIRRIQTRITVW